MSNAAENEDSSRNETANLRSRLASIEAEVMSLKTRSALSIDAESVLENATDGFVVFDADFRFTYLNRDGERLLGRSKAEVLGETQWDVFPETLGCELERQYWRSMQDRATAIFDHHNLFLDKWIEIRISPSTAGGLLVWLREVTMRRQAELKREELHLEITAERQILGEIIEKSPIAISIVRAPDFIYELVNPAFQSLWPGTQVLGRSFSDVWCADPAAFEFVANLEKAVVTGQTVDFVDIPRRTRKNTGESPETIFLTGSLIPLVGPAGIPDRILNLAVETTSRRNQEDLLRSSEARLTRAQRMANLGSWEEDLESGDVQLSTDACRIFGKELEASQMTLGILLSLVHPEDRDLVREGIQGTVARGGRCEIDHRIVLLDGTERVVRQYLERVTESGKSRLLGTIQDVTAYKRLEEKYRRSQKMEGIAQLAGGVAHDFNNLLTVINGYAELLISKLQIGDPLSELVQEISSAGNRAKALTRQLLAFSRKQAIRPCVINLDTLLLAFQTFLKRLIAENIELRQLLTPDLWSVKADPDQVEQVIMNLALNARDAMPDGGVLSIGTSNVELGAQEVQGFLDLKPGRYVLVMVADSGTGMTLETKSRLFEPFFTTKPIGEGTGLGLSMVYGIVKQHGGDVSCYSEVGLGTTFKVYWPATEQPSEPPTRFAEPRNLARGNETIVLVEDDLKVRKLVKQMLCARGYTVLETIQSTDAIDIAENYEGTLDLLLTDVVMPHMSGREIATRVVALRPNIKVIFMSGYPGGVPLTNRMMIDPGEFFLQKPFDTNTLQQTISQALATP